MIKMTDNIQSMLRLCAEEAEAGPLGLQSEQQYTTLLWLPSLLHILHWCLFSLLDGKSLSQKRADGGASSDGCGSTLAGLFPDAVV